MHRLLIFVSILLVGCSETKIEPPAFDGARAYRYIEEQVAFGPRVPGTDAWRACREYYVAHFTGLGLAVDSQSFHFFDPYSRADKPLVNVIARYRGNDSDTTAILLGAHWDSRPRTDYHSDTSRINEPIDGANDGGSGVALLMELANMLAERPPRTNIDIVLFDGEDWGEEGDSENYLLGSRHFARQGIRHRYRFGIIVDMIADRDQQIFREAISEEFAKPVNDLIFTLADSLNIETFVDSVKHTILDDHLPLSAAGVPSAVIIDFDYPYWHTEFDTPDKCSPEALTNVGRIVAKIAYDESLWPKRR